jgi:hypothetical protein
VCCCIPRVTSRVARSIDPVPISESDEEMDGIMTCHLETGLANASSLLILEQVLLSMDAARTGKCWQAIQHAT